jgi:drug/metabolite transporter (DMT)-like permease
MSATIPTRRDHENRDHENRDHENLDHEGSDHEVVVDHPGTPGGVGPRVRHLRLALSVAAVLAVLGAIVAAVAGGQHGGLDGALGFAAGVVLVAASYTASTLAIAWADSINSQMVFPIGMAMYVTKFSLLGALLIFVGATEWPGKIPMSIGIVLAVVSWTTTQIHWTRKTAHPYV